MPVTRPSGPAPHHPDDGCTGRLRTLTTDDGRAIRDLGETMLLAAFTHFHTEVAATGDHIALHYGPGGEWFLAGLLADRTLKSAPRAHRGPLGEPHLARILPDDDPQAAALFALLSQRHRQDRAPGGQCGALEAARTPLQAFLMAFFCRDVPAAQRIWVEVYQDTGTTPTPQALAFTALLVLCAARSTLPAPHPTSPLN